MLLDEYGWDLTFCKDHLRGEPARVVAVEGPSYRVVMEEGERSASIAGRLMRPDGGRRGPAGPTRPVVGDWVAVHLTPEGGARIDQVLPRRTTLSRKEPGRRTNEQVVAANVDLVLVVMAMDADFSERRLERLLTIVRHGGAAPAVLLSKSDLSGDAESMCGKARTAAPGVAVHAVSCLSGNGLDTVRALLPARKTAALIGSSGVGKSTLINRLLGAQVQATQHVIEDGRGRHTTTHRELFRLPGGALLIDNPGLREVQLWADAGSLSHAFSDVAGLATGCRFRDCSHGTEPGCAVRAAADGGDLDPARLRSFHALQAELRSAAIRRDALARREETRRWRSVHKALRRSRKW